MKCLVILICVSTVLTEQVKDGQFVETKDIPAPEARTADVGRPEVRIVQTSEPATSDWSKAYTRKYVIKYVNALEKLQLTS